MLTTIKQEFNHKILPVPNELKARYPLTNSMVSHVAESRELIGNILTGKDSRMLVVLGPCSIHDPTAALDYAHRLKVLQKNYQDKLLLVMRTYFEKPRTVSGWKGLISDPHLDASYDIGEGLDMARKLLLDINGLGIPVATEFLNVQFSEYISDLVSFGAIGARTSESQPHRELASSLPLPVGFKNRIDGNVDVAINSVLSAREPHVYCSINEFGNLSVVKSGGNPFGHVILRGGNVPNYDSETVRRTSCQLKSLGLPNRIVIDVSHANSQKKYKSQLTVAEHICSQIKGGTSYIAGIMVESFINEGRQNLGVEGAVNLRYGLSITDSCLGWCDTVTLLSKLASCTKTEPNLEQLISAG